MFRTFLSFILSFLLVLQGFAWYSPAAAQEKTSHTLAVLDLIANGVSESESRSLSSSLRGQVTREIMSERYRNLSKVDYTVVDRSQMDKIFDNLLNRGVPRIVDTLLYGKTVSKKKWYYVIGGVVFSASVTVWILSRDDGGGGEKTGTLIIDVPDKPDEP